MRHTLELSKKERYKTALRIRIRDEWSKKKTNELIWFEMWFKSWTMWCWANVCALHETRLSSFVWDFFFFILSLSLLGSCVVQHLLYDNTNVCIHVISWFGECERSWVFTACRCTTKLYIWRCVKTNFKLLLNIVL